MTFAIIVVAAALGAAAFVQGVLLGYPPASIGTEVLSAKEQAIVRACADAMLPHGGRLALSASEAGALDYFATTLRSVPRPTSLLIRLLLQFVEHGPWLFGPARRLTRQSPEARVRTLAAWEGSRIYFLRVAFTSLRTLIAMAYVAHPQVAATLGLREGRLGGATA